jgi:hypothetical protein
MMPMTDRAEATAKAADPVALVDRLLGEHEDAVLSLDKVISELSRRLDPVSLRSDSAELSTPQDCLHASAVAQRIDESTRRVRRLANAVSAAIDELEI